MICLRYKEYSVGCVAVGTSKFKYKDFSRGTPYNSIIKTYKIEISPFGRYDNKTLGMTLICVAKVHELCQN